MWKGKVKKARRMEDIQQWWQVVNQTVPHAEAVGPANGLLERNDRYDQTQLKATQRNCDNNLPLEESSIGCGSEATYGMICKSIDDDGRMLQKSASNNRVALLHQHTRRYAPTGRSWTTARSYWKAMMQDQSKHGYTCLQQSQIDKK